MFNLTDLIAKPVISLSQGTALGTLENAVFCKKLKKIIFLSVFNEELEEKLYIPVSYIINAFNAAIVVKKSPLPPEIKITENSPLKAPVYLDTGEESGFVSDIAINEKLEPVHLLLSGGGILNLKNIISFSNKAVVACFDEEKLETLKKIKPNKAPSAKQETPPDENAAETEGERYTAAENRYYLRNIVPPFNYLIGRRATLNITNQNKEIIVPKNAVIGIGHIDKCRMYGKLITLAKNSK